MFKSCLPDPKATDSEISDTTTKAREKYSEYYTQELPNLREAITDFISRASGDSKLSGLLLSPVASDSEDEKNRPSSMPPAG